MADWSELDYSMAPPGYRALRNAAVRVDLTGMAYYVLAGRDHREWLQGQATNDVLSLEPGDQRDFCLAKPTGQVVALCRAWATEGTLVVATDRPDAFEARAEETVILEDVALMHVEERFTCVQGPHSQPTSRSLPSDRTGSGGFEMPLSEAPELEVLSAPALELATLEAGIPLAGLDYTERTLVSELGAGFEMRNVSYTKGCYVGQEVLMRIKARGHTNRTWIGLRCEANVDEGSAVVYQGKEVGTVHRTALSPAFGPIASATLRNEAASAGTVVQVGGVTATVVAMPFLD